MKVVVFEDNDSKFGVLQNVLIGKGINSISIRRIQHVAEFAKLRGDQFDLCIVDIRMPSLPGGETRSAGGEILQMLSYGGYEGIPVLAITAYADEIAEQREAFAERGCIIYDFDQQEHWTNALDIFISQARSKGKYDFIIFTAIRPERDAYSCFSELEIKSVQNGGLDCWDCEIDGRLGTIILLPRMGLVNAAISVSRALELFSPRVVAMSGICGGIGDRAELGQLLVTDMCYEYQSGKWIKDAFEADPYQVAVPETVKNDLRLLIGDKSILAELESGYSGSKRPENISRPKLAVFATGSAVIASKSYLSQVEHFHRKVSGIDMEIFGFHRAVELSGNSALSFSSKVVVDKAKENKGDELHEYGCYVSAGFTIKSIKRILSPQ